MATLTVQRPGANPITYAACAAGGDQYPNSGREMVHVRNASGGSLDVVFNSQKACDQGVDHDVTVAVPAGSDRFIAAKDVTRFNNGSGRVEMTYPGGVTSLTVAVIAPN